MVEQIDPAAHAEYERIHTSEDFARLQKAYRGFVVPATIAFMVWYLTYVLCSNYASGFMNAKVLGNINVALVFGLLQFVTTFGLAYAYSRYAARSMDPIATDLREQFDREVDR